MSPIVFPIDSVSLLCYSPPPNAAALCCDCKVERVTRYSRINYKGKLHFHTVGAFIFLQSFRTGSNRIGGDQKHAVR